MRPNGGKWHVGSHARNKGSSAPSALTDDRDVYRRLPEGERVGFDSLGTLVLAGAFVMGAVFAFAAGASDIHRRHPRAGTFLVAATFILVALVVTVRSVFKSASHAGSIRRGTQPHQTAGSQADP
jgi:hypothetical protein